MSTSSSPVLVGTTAQGDCLIHLIDRATMQHSPATEALVNQTLERDPKVSVVIDLTRATYLDSTFLGCLFGVYRRFIKRKELPAADGSPRLHIHAPAGKLRELFGPLRLDRLIETDPGAAPPPAGKMLPLPESSPDQKTVCRHVMECHRRLAEMDTPARAAFTKIADAMERELAEGK